MDEKKSKRQRTSTCLDCSQKFVSEGAAARYCSECLQSDPLNGVASNDRADSTASNDDMDHSFNDDDPKCERCDKIFKSSNALKYHIENNVCHKPAKRPRASEATTADDEDSTGGDRKKKRVSIACEVCGKLLNSTTAYNYHRKNVDCANPKKIKNKETTEKAVKPRSEVSSKPISKPKSTQKCKSKSAAERRAWGAAAGEEEEAGGSSGRPIPWTQCTGGKIRELNARWTRSIPADLAIKALRNRAVSFSDTLLRLLQGMWNFSEALSLGAWLNGYIDSTMHAASPTVDLWSLAPVDLGECGNSVPFESFTDLDRCMADSTSSSSRVSVFRSVCTKECGTARPDTDVLVNAAGPVWAIAFAPLSAFVSDEVESMRYTAPRYRFFVVGVSRVGFPNANYQTSKREKELMLAGMVGPGYDIPIDVNNLHRHDNILQVWSTDLLQGKGDADHVDSRSSTVLRYCVALKGRGAVLRVDWSSVMFSAHDPVGNLNSTLLGERHILGLLAVVCGDGSCLIMLPPGCAEVEAATAAKLEKAPGIFPIVPVLSEDSVTRFRLTSVSPILCVSWCPRHSNRLCCGHANGSISVWQLPLTEERPQKGAKLIELTGPSAYLADADSSEIRSVKFCPYNADVILSVGHDKKAKLWSSRNTLRPIVIKDTSNLWNMDCAWDPFGNGFLTGGAEHPTVHYEPLWASLQRQFKIPGHRHHSVHAAIWQMQMFVPGIESGYCDYASGCDSGGPKLASVSSDGSVFVTDIPKTILTKSHADTRGTAAIFRMHRVVNQSYNSECAQSSTESLVHKTAMVYFSSSEHIIRSSVEDLRICLPPVSLHAIDNCPLPPHCNMKNDIEGSVDRNSSSESCSGVNAIYDRRTELKKMNSKSVRCKRLFAYGGSAGMIRLHAIELPWV